MNYLCLLKQTQSDIKLETEETPPPEVNDQEFNEDVLKQESEQVEVDNTDTKGRKLTKVTPEMVAKLSEILKNDWKKLATKFGYTSEEVEINFVIRKSNLMKKKERLLTTIFISLRLRFSKGNQHHTNNVKIC